MLVIPTPVFSFVLESEFPGLTRQAGVTFERFVNSIPVIGASVLLPRAYTDAIWLGLWLVFPCFRSYFLIF